MWNLSWVKNTAGDWLQFETFTGLESVKTVGVYIIWHTGQNPWTVYVGQGDVKDRLTSHRGDQRILAHRYGSALRVTWAEVALGSVRDGIERYLANELKPLVGEKHPDVLPIPVKLPWAA